jgi:hypothetical protein
MTTECNADLPYFAYRDWLLEQGWNPEDIIDVEGEEYIGTVSHLSYKLYARQDMNADLVYSGEGCDAYHRSFYEGFSFKFFNYHYNGEVYTGNGNNIYMSEPNDFSLIAGWIQDDGYWLQFA